MEYTILQKGKRIRPILCLLASDMFGGNIQETLFPALSLETFHNFTLIHDDIMDQAPLRRGKKTVYKKWNSNVAILSGDAMFAMAFQLVLKTNADRVSDAAGLLVKVAREVCEGQQYDLDFESCDDVSIDDYLEMIRLKTAVLLATSLEMGALVAGADAKNRQLVYDFGIAIGMAFQLQDDILDCYSDQTVFGKVTGGDIADNKKTYLYLQALELASEQEKKLLKTCFSGDLTVDSSEKIATVKKLYDKLGVKLAVEKVMSDYYQKASACLDAIDLAEDRKVHLRTYADHLYIRNK
jgi:Geranylgeranyl pyrophosphate synthase